MIQNATDIVDVLSGKKDDNDVSLRGWLSHIRSSGGILFLQLRDGTGVIQCTVKKDQTDAKEFERLNSIPIERTI